MSAPKVVVFGPTGGVGSSVALTAHELGAEVVLAMRDPSKTIPGIDAGNDAAGYERVKADLTEPQSVRDAVTKTGAKRAFIYLAFTSKDSMKSTIEALKEAGIELVVFLSSFTIEKDSEVDPTDIIPQLHRQVELNLEKIFGPEGYVALRAGNFVSNNLGYAKNIAEGEVPLYRPDQTSDSIAAVDIGRVGGTVLAKGRPQDNKTHIYIFGPKIRTLEDTIKVIAKVATGKSVNVRSSTADEFIKMHTETHGTSEALAKYMVAKMDLVDPSDDTKIVSWKIDKADLNNVEKYTGRKPTTLEEWAEQNKEAFAV